MAEEKNKPLKKFRAGSITATIWNNTFDKDGKTQTYQTVSFERSYKDKEGNWKTTNSLHIGDLPKGVLVLNKAFEFLIEHKSEAQPSVTEETVA